LGLQIVAFGGEGENLLPRPSQIVAAGVTAAIDE
jgi:hypothetical protein